MAQIGVIYGNPEVTSGGNALKFYASVRLEVRRKMTHESAKGESTGIRVKAKVGDTLPPGSSLGGSFDMEQEGAFMPGKCPMAGREVGKWWMRTDGPRWLQGCYDASCERACCMHV